MIKKSMITIFIAIVFLSCSGEKEPLRKTPELAGRSFDVHIFYYAWYGTPAIDGAFHHWNLEIDKPEGGKRSFVGDSDIPSGFYPALGCYSSNDPEVLNTHMTQIAASNAGVVCVSWWGKGSFTDKAVPGILDAAYSHGLKVNFLIEPFEGRTPEVTADAIRYIMDTYGSHKAFYVTDRFGNKPMFYIKDSNLSTPEQWRDILSPSGGNCIRGTRYDALVIGMWTGPDDGNVLLGAGFNGIFTYWGSRDINYGSTAANWLHMSQFAWDNGMLFIPTIAPGYDDTRIRPWNKGAVRNRDLGTYYREGYQKAVTSDPPFLTISSFNEWHEGTQIEPAVPKQIPGYTYNDYQSNNIGLYLSQTKQIVESFSK